MPVFWSDHLFLDRSDNHNWATKVKFFCNSICYQFQPASGTFELAVIHCKCWCFLSTYKGLTDDILEAFLQYFDWFATSPIPLCGQLHTPSSTLLNTPQTQTQKGKSLFRPHSSMQPLLVSVEHPSPPFLLQRWHPTPLMQSQIYLHKQLWYTSGNSFSNRSGTSSIDVLFSVGYKAQGMNREVGLSKNLDRVVQDSFLSASSYVKFLSVLIALQIEPLSFAFLHTSGPAPSPLLLLCLKS